MWRIVVACVYLGMVIRAIVLVPIAMALLLFAGWVVIRLEGSWLGLLIGGYFAWLGGPLLFRSLACFAGGPGNDNPDTRRALRRGGMLGER
jgi:hypothetical protein